MSRQKRKWLKSGAGKKLLRNLITRLNGGATQGFLALFRYTKPNLAHVEPAGDS
jgi:hypothetical protein